jgi:hypothetical protein
MVDAHGYVNYRNHGYALWHSHFVVMHIGVGFCVARSTVMGNPGPRIVGRVTVQIPTLFFFLPYLLPTRG